MEIANPNRTLVVGQQEGVPQDCTQCGTDHIESITEGAFQVFEVYPLPRHR